MRKFFQFKPIETKFDGYRFRSRLEARWAVFFKTLGIEYYYEHEGYSLDGTPYLPDFWLPQMNCFVEIKGELPTMEEVEKVVLLSTYTGKDVYIFHGNIPLPDDPGNFDIDHSRPPTLYTLAKTELTGSPSYKKVDVLPSILALLQKLEEVGIEIFPDGDHLILEEQTIYLEYIPLAEYIEGLQERYQTLSQLADTIKSYESDIAHVLTAEEGWYLEFCTQTHLRGYRWCECSQCKSIEIRHKSRSFHYHGDDNTESPLLHNSSRLLEAFTAARQARFS